MNALLNKAISELEKLKEGEEFLVKDLFIGYEWNRLNKGERLLLGSMFLAFAKVNNRMVEVLPRGTSGQQRYRRK